MLLQAVVIVTTGRIYYIKTDRNRFTYLLTFIITISVLVIRIVCNCVVVFHHIKISGTDSHALLLGLGGAVGECEGGVV